MYYSQSQVSRKPRTLEILESFEHNTLLHAKLSAL